MSELKGQPGVMHATIHITRKATGKVETYEIIGTPEPLCETTPLPWPVTPPVKEEK